ncbi:AAA family ATPase [Novosphingobium flavum]|uniref:AAA family ATPase n=1 Tax=Novosphingobium aerophilum TaxID=2839843 RepID=A0A7X1FBF8_9SPHN|nr:AAA family ATPase [Novosphingobium aerophilum]MBC2653459.1 AAA family ATPase [Novosphingobium aerophilum]MBC2662349.1 AAA family ATPase [Novosphingobium aerophilum]
MLATPTAEELTVLEDALSHITSDVLRGSGTIIGPDGQPVPDYWFGVILACRRAYGVAVKEIVRRWSQKSPRYGDGSGFEHAWSQYDPAHPKPVNIGSVFMLAKLAGWTGGNNGAVAPLSGGYRFQLLDRSAIMAQPPLRWRVKRLFPEVGIGAIYGPSCSGKSFLGFDLGISIAAGASWFGYRTAACPVTYVILEGEAGLRNRVQAWETHNCSTIPPGFKAMAQPFQLAETGQVEELGVILPQGGVVIIDTLNRSAPGLDENSSQDMGRILAGMKRLQEITSGLVLVIHHTGKDASKGLRGHSSLHAALDGAIEVERSTNGRCWSAAKVKDGEDGKAVPFALHVVDLGTDLDGV